MGVREWLCCNKLLSNVNQTHYMIFIPRNKIAHDIDAKMYGVSVGRVFTTEFLGIILDSTLCWKTQLEYIWTKVIPMCWNYSYSWKKVAQFITHHFFILISLPIFHLLQPCVGKQLCIHVRKSHPTLLFHANLLLITSDINSYTIGTSMYRFVKWNRLSDIF